MAQKTLYKSKSNRVISGVCGGIGEYLDVDPTVIRLLWVLATLAWGFGFIAYIICMFIVPEEPAGGKKKTKEVKAKVEIDERQGKLIGGLVMVFIGFMLLANNLGWFAYISSIHPIFAWENVFALVVIVMGAILLLAPKKK
jgi:phage shock protein C